MFRWRRQLVINEIDFAGCGADRHHEAYPPARLSARPGLLELVFHCELCTRFTRRTALGADDPTIE
jgi:hypothetical protein